jgi:hypothetical protein
LHPRLADVSSSPRMKNAALKTAALRKSKRKPACADSYDCFSFFLADTNRLTASAANSSTPNHCA